MSVFIILTPRFFSISYFISILKYPSVSFILKLFSLILQFCCLICLTGSSFSFSYTTTDSPT